MANEEAVLDPADTEPKKRPRGRPRKETPQHATIISDVPNPPRLKYYSDSASPNQRTASGLKWWNELSDPSKELIDVTIYRDWPVLNDPTEEGEYKYIDKLLGSQPLKNDQDFIDRWGAGDYHAYINVTPLGSTRRTIMMLFVKGSHDFKTYLPTDQRIDNPDNLSISDPANASYVAWLRSTGKIKNDASVAKEKEEMAATGNVMAELVKDMAQDRRELTQKLLEKTEQDKEIPPDPPPSPQEVISEQLSIFKSLKELVPTSDPLEMVKQVIGMAQVLTSKDSNADLKPLQDEISKLREESRAAEREMWNTRFAELQAQIRAAKETPPASNVLLPDGSNIASVIEKAVAKAVDAGLPEDTAWYVEPLKQLVPVAIPALGLLLQRLMAPAPPPAPFPMPPANFQAGQPQTAPQPQQLPAPQPQAQPAAPQPNAEEVEINRILTAISSPVIDALASGDEGDVFADYVREEYGASSQRLLAKYSEQEIAGALMMFPLTAPRMTQFPQARVAEFVKGFKEYDRDKFDAKIEAQERSK